MPYATRQPRTPRAFERLNRPNWLTAPVALPQLERSSSVWAVQLQRIRRGIRSFRQRARVAAAQGPDDPGLDLFLLEQRGDPLTARSLAIRAGHAAHPRRLRGAAVKLVRDGTCAELEARHGD